MSKTFSFHAAMIDSGGRLHQFVPGDEVPEWALSRVADAGVAPKVEAKKVEPVTEDPVKAEPAEAYDFTKPKQTRQRRK